MTNDFYSSKEFDKLKERLNKEILGRGTYSWWNPLSTPKVGTDREGPLVLHSGDTALRVDDTTYTINTPSDGSIERTRNAQYPAHGDNPGGNEVSSANEVNVDEMRNFLVGLAKIRDINLFYGRDEITYLAFRDPQGIEDALTLAESDNLNVPLKDSPIGSIKGDPNGGETHFKVENYPQFTDIQYPMESGQYVMPSGERDGEELDSIDGLSPKLFFDDYGAPPGDGNYHPFSKYVTPLIRRDLNDQGNHRRDNLTIRLLGGIPSSIYGANPRNPNPGNTLPSRPAYGGTPGSCQTACTGMCHITCDNECSESCSATCWNRCGEACTASCGNICTGCSSMCYNTCKTKCENSTGYACVKAGARTVSITTSGGRDGIPARNNLSYTTYTCSGCSYSCQFWPNKKTDCWDSACMNQCFISCTNYCSTSCLGGCINNDRKGSGQKYKEGLGQGCRGNCTLNCIGACLGICEGFCVYTCYMACKQQCTDNCSYACETECGSGCATSCKDGCTGCTSCSGGCINNVTSQSSFGCAKEGACTAACKTDCNGSCMGWGCKSICGTDSAGACEANCRLNCAGTSCTSLCGDGCNSECTTCVNTCGFLCGSCSSVCSTSCGAECNITCTNECVHSCNINCVMSCSEACGGCSNLCYSCVAMCIGICSVRCESSCTSCSHMCGWWCDSQCNRACFSNCVSFCINTCSGSCISWLTSETNTKLLGPERPPTATGYIYPNPKNRWEERESFKLTQDIEPYHPQYRDRDYIIKIDYDDNWNLRFDMPNGIKRIIRQSTLHGGVYSIDENTGETVYNLDLIAALPPMDVLPPNYNNDHAIIVVQLIYNPDIHYELSDIWVIVPFGFYVNMYRHPITNDTFIIIERDKFLLHGEVEDGQDPWSDLSDYQQGTV